MGSDFNFWLWLWDARKKAAESLRGKQGLATGAGFGGGAGSPSLQPEH